MRTTYLLLLALTTLLFVGSCRAQDADTEAEVPAGEGEAEADADAEANAETEAETEAEAEAPAAETDAKAPAGPDAEAPAEPDAEAPAGPDAETPAEPNAETEAEAPPDPDAEAPAEPNAETEAETPAEPDAETEAEAPAEPNAETEAEATAETEAEAPAEPDAETEAGAPAEPNAEPTAGTESEAETEETPVEGGRGDTPDVEPEPEVEPTEGHTQVPPAEGTAQTSAGAEPEAPTAEGPVGGDDQDGKNETTAAPEEETPVVPVCDESDAEDVCCNATGIDDIKFHYRYAFDPEKERHPLEEGWYYFIHHKQAAIITSEIIKQDYCNAQVPFYMDMNGGEMPAGDEEKTFKLCGFYQSPHGPLRCIEPQKVHVRNCTTVFIYYLKPLNLLMKQEASVCIQLPTEKVENDYLAFPEEEQRLPIVNVEDLTEDQLAGVVTLEFNISNPDEHQKEPFVNYDVTFRQMIADALNNLTDEAPAAEPTAAAAEPTAAKADEDETIKKKVELEAGETPEAEDEEDEADVIAVDEDADVKGPGEVAGGAGAAASRKKRSAQKYEADDVYYVGPTPRVQDNTMQTSVFVENEEKDVVTSDRLMRAVEDVDENDKAEEEMNLPLDDYYEGLPADIAGSVRAEEQSTSVWEEHKGLFITIIILLIIILLVLLIGLCCICCRRNRGTWVRSPHKGPVRMEQGDKDPVVVVESPLADEEIMKDEEPMVEKENPAVTKNGGGTHISKPEKDEDNGWVIPFEEGTKADKDKFDVEDTKL